MKFCGFAVFKKVHYICPRGRLKVNLAGFIKRVSPVCLYVLVGTVTGKEIKNAAPPRIVPMSPAGLSTITSAIIAAADGSEGEVVS